MKKIFELDEKDVVDILADKFKVDTERIHVTYENHSVGYGVAEHDEPEIKIIIIATE